MSNGSYTWQPTQRIFVKHLRHKPHTSLKHDSVAIGGGYATAFLAAVLKCEQCKKGKPGYVLAWGMDPKHSAGFVTAHPLIRLLFKL